MIRVLCIAHLHDFVVDAGVTDPQCPTCGCRYVRRSPPPRVEGIPDARQDEAVSIRVESGRHAVSGPPTWLSDRRTFVAAARQGHPDASEAEVRTWLERWTQSEGAT